MILNQTSIAQRLADGRILFLSDREPRINTTSIDVSLGDNYYRFKDASRYTHDGLVAQSVLDLGSPRQVEAAFTRHILDGEGGLHIEPGECVLCHTHEFVGGTDDRIVTMIKDRSTLGRFFLTTHTGAGWGDVGYHNRWTLEIKNSSPRPVILPKRARVAQIVFFEGEPVSANYSELGGAYQQGSLREKTFEQALSEWSPESMLPKVRW